MTWIIVIVAAIAVLAIAVIGISSCYIDEVRS
jgi:hypothetical protein